MFVRVKRNRDSPHCSVQVMESVREHGKVRQRIVRHLGVAASDLAIERLKACGEALIAELLETSNPCIFPPEELAEEIRRAQAQRQGEWELTVRKDLKPVRRVTTGIHEVYGRIHQDLGLDRLLPSHRYPASSRSLHHCVMARLADPKSKLATSAQLSEDFGVSLPMQKLCRMMDQLDGERREKLRRLAWTAAAILFREAVEMVIFDCTTLHFESIVRGGLKQPGCSKDAKFKESQVVLFVSERGLPLGDELFPGSTAETSSLIPAVSKMKARFDVRNVACVADRGMMSVSNLAALEAAGMDCIVGARLRSLRWRLGRGRSAGSMLGNRGCRRFLKVDGDATVSVNREKVEADARWDGIHGVLCSLKDRPAKEILEQYRGLWQVEDACRGPSRTS